MTGLKFFDIIFSSKRKENDMKKFNVHYSFYLSDSIEIDADNEEEARNKVQDMILAGELGNLNEMDIGEQKVWIG